MLPKALGKVETNSLPPEDRAESETRARVAASYKNLLRQRALVLELAVKGSNTSQAQRLLDELEYSFYALSEVWETRLAYWNAYFAFLRSTNRDP
jgi:hypothetical protein